MASSVSAARINSKFFDINARFKHLAPHIPLDELPPLNGCDEPVCECETNTIFYPDRDPYFYWVCVPGRTSPTLMPCAPGTWFSYKNQVCVDCDEWENPCGIIPPTPTPPGSTTQGQTTSTLTTRTTEPPASIGSTIPTQGTTPPPVENCDEPNCEDCVDNERLYPHWNQNYYWVCVGSRAIAMPCAPTTWFEYPKQACVDPCDWTNYCNSSSTFVS